MRRLPSTVRERRRRTRSGTTSPPSCANTPEARRSTSVSETSRWASLREVHHPDVHGWTVVGADGRKAGRVLSLLADPHDDESRFFAVELDRTALQQDVDTPGGAERITAGRYSPGPNPAVGGSEGTAEFNTGARQHAADFTGAVPRADDGREGGSGRIEPLHVL